MNKAGVVDPAVPAGKIQAVSKDVVCLSLPMKEAQFSSSSVNCWIIGTGQDMLVADTGMPGQQARSAWLANAQLMPPASVRDVVCTHMHRDHTGQASFLVRHHGARLHMTPQEHSALMRLSTEAAQPALQARHSLLRLAGAKANDATMATKPFSYAGLADMPQDYAPLYDGAVVRLAGQEWQVLAGGGHSPDAACLYSPSGGLFITGDQILPGVAPHVTVGAHDPEADPLGAYFDFLQRLGAIPDTVLVLPGHGAAFRGLQARIKALEATHRKRSQRLLAVATRPVHCVDLLPYLFRAGAHGPLRYLLIAMTLAQLNYLQKLGKIDRRQDDDGAFIYQAKA